MLANRGREEVVDKVAALVEGFLERRLAKLQGSISKYLNVNPFLMSALRHFHSFETLEDLANFLFIAHLQQGHATAFGKLVDERILPQVFGTLRLSRAVRIERRLTAAAYNEIDHIVNPDDPEEWCLLSLKAGAWTIQDSMAHNLYNSFKQIGDFQAFGKELVVGVFYGNEDVLTNKYSILRGVNPRQQEQFVELKHVRILAGRDFWAWLNRGEPETHFWVLEGTKKGSEAVFRRGESKGVASAPAKLAAEMARKYGLSRSGPIDWKKLLVAVNEPAQERKSS